MKELTKKQVDDANTALIESGELVGENVVFDGSVVRALTEEEANTLAKTGTLNITPHAVAPNDESDAEAKSPDVKSGKS